MWRMSYREEFDTVPESFERREVICTQIMVMYTICARFELFCCNIAEKIVDITHITRQ